MFLICFETNKLQINKYKIMFFIACTIFFSEYVLKIYLSGKFVEFFKKNFVGKFLKIFFKKNSFRKCLFKENSEHFLPETFLLLFFFTNGTP